MNVIPERYIKHTSTLTSSCNTTLHMWNRTVLQPRGKSRLTIRNPTTRKKHSVEFFVVAENLIPLLGKETSEAMGLITISYNKFESVANIVPSETGDIFITFADVFDDKQGIAHFEIDNTVTPVTSPAVRVFISLINQVKAELNKLTERDIITPVDQPTDLLLQRDQVSSESVLILVH